MSKFKLHISNALKTDLLLFAGSFCIYFFYLHHVFLNLNSLLSSITGDSLKNYYTFAWHIKNDSSLLQFTGMNYPFGEHCVYTDCQPALCWILKLLPFAQNYLIGILHGCIFLSFIITPVILNKIMQRLGFPLFASVCIALGITLLSPQFFRIYEGHYALTYAFVIPLCMLLLLRFFEAATFKRAAQLFIYNTFIFFIHPYLAFGLCVFCFLSLVVFRLTDLKKQFLHFAFQAGVSSLLPIVVFKVFMLLTDTHVNRTTEPYGISSSVTSAGSMLVPITGPFQHLLESVFKTLPGEFEGYCYLGIMLIALVFIFAITLPFLFKTLSIPKEIFSLMIAALFLLLFAFGLHNQILKWLNLQSATLNQFRALGRFSWFFYYVLPVFIFSCFYTALKARLSNIALSRIFGGLAIFFFLFNLAEGGSVIRLYEKTYWQDRNIFNPGLLNAHERQVLAGIAQQQPQAIIPLPTFYIGNEVFGRLSGDDLSDVLISSALYSYHAALPIISGMLSRTSITETQEGINILNSYKKNRPALALMNNRSVFVIKSNVPLLPDEERLWDKVKNKQKNDSLQFGYLEKSDLLRPAKDQQVVTLSSTNPARMDSSGFVFIKQRPTTPFVIYSESEYELIVKADSNTIKSGTYIASLHFHSGSSSWKDMLCHFLVTKTAKGKSEWNYFLPMATLSGFYTGYAVFECKLQLEKEYNYEFLVRRDAIFPFRISDFMLRPEGTTVQVITAKDTVWNNFPAQ